MFNFATHTIRNGNKNFLPKKKVVTVDSKTTQPVSVGNLANLNGSLQASGVDEFSVPGMQMALDFTKKLPKEIIRAEVNFLLLPFFALSRSDIRRRASTEYRATVHRGGEKLEVSWIVSSNSRYGYPGPFDRQVYRAVEQTLNEMRPPIENPVPLGSLYRIAKLLNLKDSGQSYRDIKKAIQRIVATTIESSGAFYQKKNQRWLQDTFHLYDRIVFVGESLPSGKPADTNYLFLSSWYLDNLNARYVRPLDYTYFRSLKSALASRLYELLGVKFYGLGHYPYIRYRYSNLCQLLPLTRQRYASQAKQKLAPAHQELTHTDFLSNVEWEEVPGEDHDWYITYWPGPKAKEELQLFRQQVTQPKVGNSSKGSAFPSTDYLNEPVATIAINRLAARGRTGPSSGSRLSKGKPAREKPELTNPQTQALKQLKKMGVGRVAAEDLVRHSDPQAIRNWIRLIEGDKNVQDPPAYLVTALREKWQLPESFHRREAERKEAQRQELERHRRENCSKCEGRGVYYVSERTVAPCNHQVQNAIARPTGTKLEEQVIGETKSR